MHCQETESHYAVVVEEVAVAEVLGRLDSLVLMLARRNMMGPSKDCGFLAKIGLEESELAAVYLELRSTCRN